MRWWEDKEKGGALALTPGVTLEGGGGGAGTEGPGVSVNTPPLPARRSRAGPSGLHPPGSDAAPGRPLRRARAADRAAMELTEGSLVWARVQGHPWWPGQVGHPQRLN